MKSIRIVLLVNELEKEMELSGDAVGYKMENPETPGISKFYADDRTIFVPARNILYVEMTFPEGK